jgi:glycosyltransferase involved in cell wall biosynthesis
VHELEDDQQAMVRDSTGSDARNEGACVPLTVLSVAYPLARVSVATAGGAEQVLLQLDRMLVEQGHRSLVVAATGSRCSGLIVPVAIPEDVLDERAKREAQRRFRHAIRDTLRRYEVDVVHMHGIDFDEYCPDWDGPIVVTLHLPLDWYPQSAFTKRNRHFVCVSRSQAHTAPGELQVSKIIPNGVDLDGFCPAARQGNYVLVLGRVCPEKGTHLAIESARETGDTLLIAGTVFDYPEHRAYFEQMVRPTLGDRVHFLGAVGGKRKIALLAGAKCLLIPSLARETSSLAAMEAMACGTPVIAWKSGALKEIVANERTGFLVSSAEEMAAALRKVSKIDRHECRREAERRFSNRSMLAAYLRLYAEVGERSSIPELQAA